MITLSISEIKKLAEYAGLTVSDGHLTHDDMVNCINVDTDGSAWFCEYPEEDAIDLSL